MVHAPLTEPSMGPNDERIPCTVGAWRFAKLVSLARLCHVFRSFSSSPRPSPQSEMMMKAVPTDSPETMFPITLLSSPNEPTPKGGHYPAAPTSIPGAMQPISGGRHPKRHDLQRYGERLDRHLGLRRSQPNTLTIDIGEAMDPDSNLG